MLLLVLAANLFADAVRDALDPRVRADFLRASPWRQLAARTRPATKASS